MRVDRAAIAGTAAGRGPQRAEADRPAAFTLLALPHAAGADPLDTGAPRSTSVRSAAPARARCRTPPAGVLRS
ncbi:hypothetical protein [Streptomyces sp. NPDC054783]